MTELCRSHKDIKKLNEGSLDRAKLKIYNEDAYEFLENNAGKALYDVILVDMPDPNSETVNKLYTVLFYRL